MQHIYYHFTSLSKEEWLTVFNSDIVTSEFWDTVKILLSMSDHKLNAKCITEILGISHHIVLNNHIGTIGHKIYEMFDIKNPPLRLDNTIRWWNIVFDGEDVYSGSSAICYWILKKEMLAALEDFMPCDKKSTRTLNKPIDLYQLSKNYVGIDNLEGKEKKAVLSVRINQGKIRQAALQKYNCECALCGLKIPALLTASHIKPWARSSPQEKGDLNNILLLCPNHNALFDRFLITFADDGTIMIDSRISAEDKIRLGISDDMKITISEKSKEYLAFHRKVFLKRTPE